MRTVYEVTVELASGTSVYLTADDVELSGSWVQVSELDTSMVRAFPVHSVERVTTEAIKRAAGAELVT